MPMTSREAALKAIFMWRRVGTWSEAALDNIIKSGGLSSRDASLSSAIFYGVLQNMALCDYYISCYSSIKKEKIQPQVLDILRISVYQILFLDRIPDNASVSEGVELAKKYANQRAAAFVNAVLRKISSNSEHLPELPGDKIDVRLSIKYSHPLWFVRRIITILGEKQTEAFLCKNNEVSPTVLQINSLKSNFDPTISEKLLKINGISSHQWLTGCLLLSSGGNIADYDFYKNGEAFVQDAAARLSVMALDPKPGENILDGCAAPGGKSFSSAISMNNTGSVTSCDIHEKKLFKINEGAKRLGIDIIKTKAMDSGKRFEEFVDKYDGVIADVPCSGLGIIRKKPEIRYKNPEDIASLPDIQLRILNNLALYVKPNGRLIYSTCTVLPEENEGVVKKFLETHSEYRPDPFTLPGDIGEVKSGMITLWPQIHGTDGFFICRLRREK